MVTGTVNKIVSLFSNSHKRVNCFPFSVAKNGKDGNGLKLEKTEPMFSTCDAMTSKNYQKIILVSSPEQNSFDIFLIALQEHFMYG